MSDNTAEILSIMREAEEADETDEPMFGDGDGGGGGFLLIQPYTLVGVLSRLLMFFQADVDANLSPVEYTVDRDEDGVRVFINMTAIDLEDGDGA